MTFLIKNPFQKVVISHRNSSGSGYMVFLSLTDSCLSFTHDSYAIVSARKIGALDDAPHRNDVIKL